jgi:hypothetical protein
MIEIEIPRSLNKQIEEFIEDDAVKREYGYTSIQNFVIEAIEGELSADKDIVFMD